MEGVEEKNNKKTKLLFIIWGLNNVSSSWIKVTNIKALLFIWANKRCRFK